MCLNETSGKVLW